MDVNFGLDQNLINAVAAITEASCSGKKMEKEELHPNQKVLDKNKNGKLDADDFKKLRKEEEDLEEGMEEFAKAQAKKRADARKAKQKMSEEVEELDEISGKVLGSYIQKARADAKSKYAHEKELDANPKVKKISDKITDLYGRKEYTKSGASKNQKAVDKAHVDREAAKKKLDPDYPNSASRGGNKRMRGVEKAIGKLSHGKLTNEELDDYSLEEIQDFMMSEDFEQLDELSKNTLGSYVKKATDDYTNRETRISRALDNSNKMFLDPNINKAAVKQANRKIGMNKAIDKLTKEQVEEIEMLAAKHGLGE